LIVPASDLDKVQRRIYLPMETGEITEVQVNVILRKAVIERSIV